MQQGHSVTGLSDQLEIGQLDAQARADDAVKDIVLIIHVALSIHDIKIENRSNKPTSSSQCVCE